MSNEPRTRADASAPTRMAICIRHGVPPTQKPVFKSCEVVPPFDAAMQTMPPIDKAVTKYGSAAVQPSARKTRQVIKSVATVIPEIGFDDEPTSPVRRDETVTNKNPRTIIKIAPRNETIGFVKTLKPSCGKSIIAATKPITPITTHFIERSRSVRGTFSLFALEPPRKSASPPFKPCQIVGRLLASEMIPAIATAPAPIYKTYAPRTPSGSISEMSFPDCRSNRFGHSRAEKFDHRNQNEIRQNAAAHHQSGDIRSDDVADTEQSRVVAQAKPNRL